MTAATTDPKEKRRRYQRSRYVASEKGASSEELCAFLVRFHLTQAEGARICRVSLPTFERWCQGKWQMPGAAWVLLRITCDPEARRRWLDSLKGLVAGAGFEPTASSL
jgi:DNA-binding transcriptional regulator YiaG